jgi:hypothetical protein
MRCTGFEAQQPSYQPDQHLRGSAARPMAGAGRIAVGDHIPLRYRAAPRRVEKRLGSARRRPTSRNWCGPHRIGSLRALNARRVRAFCRSLTGAAFGSGLSPSW